MCVLYKVGDFIATVTEHVNGPIRISRDQIPFIAEGQADGKLRSEKVL